MRVTAKWALYVGLVALLGAAPACGGSEGARSSTAAEQAAEDDEPLDPEGKEWGGWRWKGARDDCFFLYDNRCFAERAAACKAAGCDEAHCTHDDGAPATVSCKK
jgi:hypothetical protein